MPGRPQGADLGCGSGAATLALAEILDADVIAADVSAPSLAVLAEAARAAGLTDRVRPLKADFTALDWPEAHLDLIWSEGSSYMMGLPEALTSWRRFLKPGGVLVVPDAVWLTHTPSQESVRLWADDYPGMTDLPSLRGHAKPAGFEILEDAILPKSAWLSYYADIRAGLAVAPADLPEDFAQLMANEANVYDRNCEDFSYVVLVLQRR
ncbi:MAG: SAM-dependent methyltransferase [Maricaulaceae bacterium]